MPRRQVIRGLFDGGAALISLAPAPSPDPSANVTLSTVRGVRMLQKCLPARSHHNNLQPSLYNCSAGVEGPV